MLVYRFEDDSKIGPYNSSNREVRIKLHIFGTKKCPTPHNDKFEKDYQYSMSICAFRSKKQMLSWFSKRDIRHLFKSGFYLLVTVVNRKEVVAGKAQILINRHYFDGVRDKGIKIRSLKEL